MEEPLERERALSWLRTAGLDAGDLNLTHVLKQVLNSIRGSDQWHPAVLAASGAVAKYSGDVDRAIRLYRRSLAAGPDRELEWRIREDLAVLEINRNRLDHAQDLIDPPLRENAEDSRFRALRAWIRACQKDERAKIDIEYVLDAKDNLDDLPHVRALIRTSIASHYLRDAGRAERLAHQAAVLAESARIYTGAARAWHMLYVHYHATIGDVARARFYAQRAADAAHAAGDATLYAVSLIAEYEIAVEAGDLDRVEEIRAILLKQRRPEQYGERFASVVADAVYEGLVGNFKTMESILSKTDIGAMRGTKKAMYYSLLAVSQLGSDNLEHAVASARKAIESARIHKADSPIERRDGFLARIVGGAVMIEAQQHAKGLRAVRAFLQHAPDALRHLADAVAKGDYSSLAVTEPYLYGYGLLFESVRKSPLRAHRHAGLTSRQIEILQLRSDGSSIAQIAKTLKLTPATVRLHLRSAADTLGAASSDEGVAIARRSGLIR
jgi:two-component system response regulator DesR